MTSTVRKAVIPAAGLGTRFLPATKALAKEMLPIVDKPTIQFIVEEALKSGIEDILVVTGGVEPCMVWDLVTMLRQPSSLEVWQKLLA